MAIAVLILLILIISYGFYVTECYVGLVTFWIFSIVVISIGIFAYDFREKKAKKQKELKKRIYEEKITHQEEERKRQYEEAEKHRNEFLNKKRFEFKAAVDSIPLFEIYLNEEKHNRNPEINIVDKEYKNITKATPVTKIKDFVAVDVETTGLKTGGNDIIQLSAIKYKNFQAVEAFDAYLKPRKNIPQEATAINGITDEMVEDAPKFYQIIDCFNAFIEDLPLVAHNAPFDIKHLYVNGLDSVENKTVYDTLALSRQTYKGEDSYKLVDICKQNNIYVCNAHDSLYDSYAAGELFKSIVADRKGIDIDGLFTTD